MKAIEEHKILCQINKQKLNDFELRCNSLSSTFAHDDDNNKDNLDDNDNDEYNDNYNDNDNDNDNNNDVDDDNYEWRW